MIGVVIYNQVASPLVGVNSVTITSHTDKEVSGSAVGFHVGGDSAWFFTRNVGVGGTVRFNRGTIAIAEPLSGQNADLKVGHTGVGGGLRLRF
jgi:hypothetical protein